MHHNAGSVASAIDKFTVPAFAWLTHVLHVALPDLVLMVTLIYTVLQIVVLIRNSNSRKEKPKEDKKESNNGS